MLVDRDGDRRRWIVSGVAVVIADDEQSAGIQIKAVDMAIGPNQIGGDRIAADTACTFESARGEGRRRCQVRIARSGTVEIHRIGEVLAGKVASRKGRCHQERSRLSRGPGSWLSSRAAQRDTGSRVRATERAATKDYNNALANAAPRISGEVSVCQDGLPKSALLRFASSEISAGK